MAKIRKNLLLVVLSLVLVFSCFMGIMPLRGETAKAAGDGTYTYAMLPGASVRKVDNVSAGLRFASYIDASGYVDSEDISYGMIIAPYDYIAKHGALTPTTVFGDGATYCGVEDCECSKTHIINLTSESLVDVTDLVEQAKPTDYVKGSNYVGFKGVITNIKEQNYLRKFVGIAYTYDKTAGTSIEKHAGYEFVDVDFDAQARSVAYVAQKSIDADVEDTAGGCLANYVAKSYGAIEFDADVTELALNKNIVAEGTFIKGSANVEADAVTATIKSGLQAYQYANNKVLSGKAVGELVTVTVSAKSPDGAYTYTKDVENVEVKKGDYQVLDDVIVAKNLGDGLAVVNKGDADFAMYVNGDAVTSALAYDKGVLSFETEDFAEVNGLQAVIVESGDNKYAFDIEVYDRSISTASEFTAWYNAGLSDNADWVILTNDINLSGETLDSGISIDIWADPSVLAGFAGTFNGNGYTISNATTTRGLFPAIKTTGVVKNLIVKNATTTSTQNGFIGYANAGKLENCYFQGVNKNTDQLGSAMFGRWHTDTATATGVVVVVDDNYTYGAHAAHHSYPSNAGLYHPGSLNGVYIVSDTATTGTTKLSYKSTDIGGVYKLKSEFASAWAGSLPAGLSSDFWTIGADGVPAPIGKSNDGADYYLINQDVELEVVLGVPNATAIVWLEGERLGAYTTNAQGVITIDTEFASAGVKSLHIEVYSADLEKTDYYKDLEVYDRAIGTKAEFVAWYNAGLGNNADWVILTNDINLSGETLGNGISVSEWTVPSTAVVGFEGTFNGNGYTISNATTTNGLFAAIEVTGVVKNLIATGIKTSTARAGLIGYVNAGKLENCYFQGAKTSDEAQFSSALFYRWYTEVGASATSVVVDVTHTTNIGTYATHTNYDSAYRPNKLDGVYVISNKATADTKLSSNQNDVGGVYADKSAFASACEDKLPAGLSADFWTIGAEGIPVPRATLSYDLADKFVQVGATEPVTADIDIANVTTTVKVAGQSIGYFLTDADGVISIPASFFAEGDNAVEIIVSRKGVGAERFAFNVNVSIPTTQLANQNFVIGSDDLTVNTGKANADVNVLIADQSIGVLTTDENGVLTIESSNFATHGNYGIEIQILDDDAVVEKLLFNVEVYDRAISTKEEFLAWYNKDETSGHGGIRDNDEWVILTADIDLGGASLTYSAPNTFATAITTGYGGTFNGNGHRITNCKTLYGLFPVIETAGVIKNLAVLDLYTVYSLDGATAFGAGGFATLFAGKIENCYIHMQLEKTEATYIGVMSQRAFDGSSLKNVVIDARNQYANPSIFHENGYHIRSVENVYLVWNKASFDAETGAPTNFNNGTNVNSFVYASLANMNGTVTDVPANFDSKYWTYDPTRGLIMNSALTYTPARTVQ